MSPNAKQNWITLSCGYYQNADKKELGGAISANYRGFFLYIMFTIGHFKGENDPLIFGSRGHFNFRGLIPHPAGLGISLGL